MSKATPRRRISPLWIILATLALLAVLLLCVWFGGKALLTRVGIGRRTTPSPTAVVSTTQVLSSKTQTVGPDGGSIVLDTGVKVVFPAGAVTRSMDVSVKQLDASQFVDEQTSGILLDCSAAMSTFDRPVEFHIPLPAWFTPRDADAVLAGVWDETTGAVQIEPSSVVMTDGKPELVVEATHFSWRIFEWFKKNYGTPPTAAGPLEIPYYSQSGGYCWAATLQMLNEAAHHSEVNEEFSIIGFVGIDDSGLGARAARSYPSISGLISAQTRAWPERLLWSMKTQSALRTYIRRQIAFQGRPVGLIFGTHAWVFVGYDATSFDVMDPQGQSGDIYKSGTWERLGLGDWDEMTTVVVPQPLASDRPLVTVNIKDGAVQFEKPKTSTPADQINFQWDYTRRDVGYSWYSKHLGAVVPTITGEATELRILVSSENGIEIANSHWGGAPAAVRVNLEIQGKGPNKTHYSTGVDLSVKPREMERFKIPEIPVSAFRDPAPVPVEYSLRVRVVVGGKVVDDAGVTFVLEPGGTPTPTLSRTPGKTPTATTEAVVAPAQGEWVLQAIVPHVTKAEDSACYFGNRVSLGDGSFSSSGSWTDKGCVEGGSASGSIHCTCAWSAPASYLKVGSTLSMDLSCQATASQTGGRRSTGAQGWVWYTVNPPENNLAGRFSWSHKFVQDVLATGWSDQFPVSAARSGSTEVPGGSKGDVLVIVVFTGGQGGIGHQVYKYAYQGTDPVPPRGIPAEGLTPLAPESTAISTPEPTETETPTPEPTATATPPPVPVEPAVTPTEEYGAGEREIFVVTSIHTALNGASELTRFAVVHRWLVTRIRTYHWNNGRGAEPGWIALRADDGTIYGPWWAVGEVGSGGVANAYWEARPDTIIPAGVYTVIDSDPDTWAQNEDTGGRGMSWGYGIPR